MAEIKAVDTYYNGYKFRSRLEARWAVFFDNAFIEYQYEPEGFVFSDGKCYLPDFYLPMFHMYIEIKPIDTDIDTADNAKEKLVQLFNGDCYANKGNGITVAIFFGDPMENINLIYCKKKENGEISSGWYPMKFLRGVYGEYKKQKYSIKKTETIIAVYDKGDDCIFASSAFDPNSRLISAREITGFATSFKSAKARARQARFEYGERG